MLAPQVDVKVCIGDGLGVGDCSLPPYLTTKCTSFTEQQYPCSIPRIYQVSCQLMSISKKLEYLMESNTITEGWVSGFYLGTRTYACICIYNPPHTYNSALFKLVKGVLRLI